MANKLFDSHAHYYDGHFKKVQGGVNALLEQLFAGEVGTIVNVGTDLQNSQMVIDTAARYENMYAAVGIHPSDGQDYEDIPAVIDALREMIGDKETRKAKKIVALGEIGLDYHYPDTDKPHQQTFFEEQLRLAEELDIPVIIHDREAHGDCFDAVCRHPSVQGVFHCYSGSAEMAKDLVRRGWYISFSGVVTYHNAPKVREALEAVPHDRILIETDCPYLAPVPHRGKMNHSGLMRHTAETVAEVLGLSYDEVVALTAANAGKLFGI